jgi:glycyl-tRNA synthetase (class II)
LDQDFLIQEFTLVEVEVFMDVEQRELVELEEVEQEVMHLLH